MGLPLPGRRRKARRPSRSNKISNENKFGVVEADAAGKDDFTSTELVIPFGKPINIVLNSRDVIHSFYVPFFRLYQDAVPGRTISWVWFKVERPGNFELACSQLCGTGHYNMKAPIRVVSQEEYEQVVCGKSPGRRDCQGAGTTLRPLKLPPNENVRGNPPKTARGRAALVVWVEKWLSNRK